MTMTNLASHLVYAADNLKRAALVLLALSTPVLAQPEPEFFDKPYIYGQWEIGRKTDESQLRYCIDPRDVDFQVASEIGSAIAGSLLLEPVEIVIKSEFETEDITRVYRHLIEQCSFYMGFKLLPEGYDTWSMPTRGYYEAKYAYVTKDPSITRLEQLPAGKVIGVALGTTAHVRLANYNNTQPADRRWRIFPIGTNELAVEALYSGAVDVALVWEPALWATQNAASKYRELMVMASAPIPETTLPVGALMLSNETFLRNSLDQAISALVADGTIDQILSRHAFPAHGGR